MEALLIGLLENSDDAPRLRSWLPVENPNGFVAARLVEILHMLPVVNEIRPAQIVQAPGVGNLTYSRGRRGNRLPCGARKQTSEPAKGRRVPLCAFTGARYQRVSDDPLYTGSPLLAWSGFV